MKILLYNHLNPKKIPAFEKIRAFLEADDFRSAGVKKVGTNLYRAKLDYTNRLLFSIYGFREQKYALILECIENHAYEKSRFLSRGVVIDENKIPDVKGLNEVDGEPLVYVNPSYHCFNLLDKIISFDEIQQTIFSLKPPVIIIGSAGSGKTALTLEKMKEMAGDILYITQSPYLVKNSRDLYYSHNYFNDDQQIDFLSFREFLESIHVPEGRELNINLFNQWFSRYKQTSGIKDGHKLFEEFKGVLTGPATDKPWLEREDYLSLGVKQSIFTEQERAKVYDIFEKYRAYLKNETLYDSNIVSFEYLSRVEPKYDFVVVDEVQDLTNIQLFLILKTLRQSTDFLLCGDSNQIVHPNFFSWSKIKTFFYQQESTDSSKDLIRILNTNYRNSPQITEIANKILKIKNCRFGSIDKESNYLVVSNAHNQGNVVFLNETDAVKRDLDEKTRKSTKFAVIVMHPEQKDQAAKYFNTPLVFSIQEAKGLEYQNIILYNFVSSDEKRYREITQGVSHEDLFADLHYSRGKDKTDKALEIYKFYINALYVAITRAVINIYIIEAKPKQKIFGLLGLKKAQDGVSLEDQGSSISEWQQEAHKLELQGKQEQAEKIRSEILHQKKVTWEILTGESLQQLRHKAIEEGAKKAKLALFEYCLIYNDRVLLNELINVKFRPALHPEKGLKIINQKYYLPYQIKNPTGIMRLIDQYGVDFRNLFNQTPMMIASRLGNESIIKELHKLGADSQLVNNAGFNAFQIALEQGVMDPKYTRKKLGKIYHLLQPDSISIQVDGKLIKIDNHLMEFMLLNLMISMFYCKLADNIIRRWGAFAAQDFADILEHMPEALVPKRRTKRAYISSILSKNEVNRKGPYNRKLFYRIKRGQYIINPWLSVKVGDEWTNIYQLLDLDLLAYGHVDQHLYYGDINENFKHQIECFNKQIRNVTKLPLGSKLPDQSPYF